MKRYLSFLLALVLLAGVLSGCKSPAAEPAAKAAAGTSSSPEAQTLSYKAAPLPLPDEVDTVQASLFTENALYLSVMRPGDKTVQDIDEVTGEVYGYRPYVSSLYRESLPDGEITLLDVPAEGFGSPQINALAQDSAGSVHALCQSAASEAADASYLWSIVSFSSDGAYLGTIRLDLPAPDGDGGVWLQTLKIDDAGHIICSDYENLYLFDKGGSLLQTLSHEGASGNLAALSDGKIGILSYADSGAMTFRPVNTESLSWGEEIPISVYAWDIFPASGQNAFFYFDDGCIYSYDLAAQSRTRLLSLLDCDLDASDLAGFFFRDDGSMDVLLRTQGEGVENSYSLYTLTPVDPSTLPEKTVLTLATMSLSESLRRQIAKFNRESEKYRIEVQDYSQYNEIIASPGSYTEDSSSALLKLNTELLSGNLPDLIDVSGGELPVAQYAARGFLEDLMPYLSADSDCSPDKLMKNVLDAVKTGDKLYQLPTSFSVIGAAGKREIVGGYDAWTLDAMKDAMTKLSPDATVFNVDYTKSHVLYACLASSLDRFISWESGECCFDGDDFRALLNFANSFPESFDTTTFDFDSYASDYRRVGQKQQLLANISFSGFDDIYYQLEAMGNDADFVGYPGAEGGFGCGFLPLGAISMTTACKDKSGAWGFISSLLSQDAQMQLTAFPMLRSAFEKQAENAMKQEYVTDEAGNPVLDANGNPIRIILYTVGFFSETVDVYAVTPEQYQTVCDLIDATHALYSFDQNILDIVSEESAAFFAGAKTEDDTVAMIQNRVSLYIAEQK